MKVELVKSSHVSGGWEGGGTGHCIPFGRLRMDKLQPSPQSADTLVGDIHTDHDSRAVTEGAWRGDSKPCLFSTPCV